nr:hypothetical protein [Tanacetum cinerariifolium]
PGVLGLLRNNGGGRGECVK